MRYLDVCAGISASSVAWKPLGWEAAAYSEIEPAPRAILEHRQGALPVGWDHRHAAGSNTTPLFGDFTQIEAHHVGPIDLLVGGTPCQDFSVAGLRAGMDGDRGNLSLEFLRLADRTRPRWLVWENVPGVLSIDGGRAFGAILGGLGELGYGFAYRVLDAQHFGVPQRRRRVFVVGYLGDHRRAAAVLFERYGMSGHPAPRAISGKAVAALTSAGVGTCGADDNQGQAGHLIAAAIADTLPAGGNSTGGNRYPGTSAETASSYLVPFASIGNGEYAPGVGTIRAKGADCGGGSETLITRPMPFDTTQITSPSNRSNPKAGDPCHPLAAGMHPPAIAFTSKDHGQDAGSLAPTLRSMSGKHANAGGQVAVAIPINPNAMRGDSCALTPSIDAAGKLRLRDPGLGVGEDGDPADTLQAAGPGAVGTASAVRRLTPRECERLQGFPDDYTLVPNRGKPMADGPRYKALGNSMAVPVMRWIGERIEAVEALAERAQAA